MLPCFHRRSVAGQVGYSSDSEGEEQAAAAAAAAAAGPSSSSKRRRRERHLADPSEPHTYEVGAAGAVREVHGHMVGPDEADLIESDDSDKVRTDPMSRNYRPTAALCVCSAMHCTFQQLP